MKDYRLRFTWCFPSPDLRFLKIKEYFTYMYVKKSISSAVSGNNFRYFHGRLCRLWVPKLVQCLRTYKFTSHTPWAPLTNVTEKATTLSFFTKSPNGTAVSCSSAHHFLLITKGKLNKKHKQPRMNRARHILDPSESMPHCTSLQSFRDEEIIIIKLDVCTNSYLN